MDKQETLQSLIFIDSADPEELKKAKEHLGYIDGLTTNPSLVAKNPEITAHIAAGKKFTQKELLAEYKKIIQTAAGYCDGPVSVEIYADYNTIAAEMIEMAREMYQWIPNAYIKIPIMPEGLKAASLLCAEMRLNMTACFSVEQAAAVYAAARHAQHDLFISPLVGRLDDIGINGMDLVKNILKLYREFGDGHVQVLAASMRGLDHFYYALNLSPTAVTLPPRLFNQWADAGFAGADESFVYDPGSKKSIFMPADITLEREWTDYNIEHEISPAVINKFAEDWKKLLS